MKIKYILPLILAGAMFGCSDDSSNSTAADPNAQPGDPSACVDPNGCANPATSSASIDPLTSSASIDPLTSSASVDPLASSASVDPLASSASVDPNAQQSVDPNAVAYKVPTLTELDPTKEYTFYGCELTGKEQFKYGRFEARMKMAAISGSVSSMFLNYDNSWMKGAEPWNEIDIEVLGKDPTSWQSNIITREPDTDGKTNKNITSEKVHTYGFDATSEFHLYAIVWTPEYIAWEIDSVEVRRDVVGNPDGLAHDQVAFMTEMQSLRFNLWASKTPSWTGKFTGIGLPVEQQIDYVRVYKYDEATKGFTFYWQDDFDGDDIEFERWSAGSWEMEKVQYRPDNLVVQNGMVHIILDYEAH